MKTFNKLLTPQQAKPIIEQGGIIAYPTEAVYGLGCDPFHPAAVLRLRTLKGRLDGRGFIIIASDWQQVQSWVQPLSAAKLSKILSTWPGPVTWIFQASSFAPESCAAEDNTIAVRVSNHPVVIELCNTVGSPLVSTSANPYGLSPARSIEEVWQYFPSDIDGVVSGELGGNAQPSQIWDALTGVQIR